ncbi:MAG: hypothetical protein AB1714_24430 [Acidobacteriota bacterium]
MPARNDSSTLRGIRVTLGLSLGLLASLHFAAAQTDQREKVPEPLAPWVGWVLHGYEGQLCPFFLGSEDRQECVWPGALTLVLDEKSGQFTQDWRVYAEDWAALPGDSKLWPQDVRVDGAPAVVIAREGAPCVKLSPGVHSVAGRFQWDSLPELLQVPAGTGLLAVTVRGRRVEFPNRDEQGRLWLQKAQAAEEAENRLDVIVHRRIVDDIPLVLVTRLELKVSGRNREVTLGRALPEGFVPMSLQGPLPSRLDPDGHLRVQVRSGSWNLELTARHEGPVGAMTLPAPDGPWDTDEAWVFDARPALRVVNVEGVPSIDPQQTQLPEEWRTLPAYLVRPGDTMKLVERKRGDSDPAPDRLTLDRTFWLDFKSGGYTVKDNIAGTLSRSWRLEMQPPAKLGRVAIAGQDQFITSLKPGAPAGIEVRQGQLSLESDSRVDGTTLSLPAVSWNHDFEEVSATLHLPPGWRLIHAIGVDRASPTWIDAWTLLDLFLVLIIGISAMKLWGSRWGAVALLTVVLLWHERSAPQWVWLFLLTGEALVRALPEGRFLRWMKAYRMLVRVVLVLIAIPFLILQARGAIYPQLEQPWTGRSDWGLFDAMMLGQPIAEPRATMKVIPEPPPPPPPGPQKLVAPAQVESVPEEKARLEEEAHQKAEEPGARQQAVEDKVQQLESLGYVASRAEVATRRAAKIATWKESNVRAPDPRAQVSTGPGLPCWTSMSPVRLAWSGPVKADQRLRLLLIPPSVEFVLAFVRILLAVALVLCMLGQPVGPILRGLRGRFGGAKSAAALVVVLLLAHPLSAVGAEYPPGGMLEELRKRLLEKPGCQPECAQSPRMRLEVAPTFLRARIQIDAAAVTAVPLPGIAKQWTPHRVLIDEAPARGMLRTSDGLLWIPLSPGTHQVLLEGALPDRDTVQIPLPLKPHRVEASVSGWILDGLHEDGLAEDNLQLSRVRGARGGTGELLSQESLPPFVRVEREISVGLSWLVETRVARLTPVGAAIVVEVPLLPGESITSADVRAKERKALVSMSPQATEVRWESVIAEAGSIALKAPDSVPWVEVWRLDASPMWHIETRGIPQVLSPGGSPVRVREWHPWPAETVEIDISRPEGVAGQTMTIDHSALAVMPGRRATDATLTLSYRSSRGGQHIVKLPDGADLQLLTIDGVAQPLRLEKGSVTFPVTPGSHNAQIKWQQSMGVGLRFRTPLLDTGLASVNADAAVTMPADRWTLLVGGPRLGPAVLFWSLLVVFLLASIGLGQIKLTPLRWKQWFLLGLGLTQSPIIIAALVVIWLLALGARKERPSASSRSFNLIQVLLVLLTLVALACLFWSIAQGLLGLPDMQIRGNGSTAQLLRWYQDRSDETLPVAWVFSVPLMVYRAAMLAWALWLAVSLVRWLKWGWTCFAAETLWRSES